MIGILRELFRRVQADETILARMKPFSAFRASQAKRRMVINLTSNDGA